MPENSNAAYKQGFDIIADFLRAAGLSVNTNGGWVFVEHDGKELWIGAEYGAELDASVREVKP